MSVDEAVMRALRRGGDVPWPHREGVWAAGITHGGLGIAAPDCGWNKRQLFHVRTRQELDDLVMLLLRTRERLPDAPAGTPEAPTAEP